MRRILKPIILFPIGLLLLLFALVNREMVTFTLDPLGATDSFLAFRVPLFALAFVFVIIGVIVGGTAAWLRQHKWRRAARARDHDARMLRSENERLRRELDAAQARPGVPGIGYRPPAV